MKFTPTEVFTGLKIVMNTAYLFLLFHWTFDFMRYLFPVVDLINNLEEMGKSGKSGALSRNSSISISYAIKQLNPKT